MKARTICKRCHRLNPSGGAGYCLNCTQALREAERRKPTLAPPADVAPPPVDEAHDGTPVLAPKPAVDPAVVAAEKAARKQARLARRVGSERARAAVAIGEAVGGEVRDDGAVVFAGADLAPGIPEPEPSTARSVPDPAVTAEEEVLTGTWAPSPTDLDLEDPPIAYTTDRVVPASELRASDVPRGVDLDDLAADLPPAKDES